MRLAIELLKEAFVESRMTKLVKFGCVRWFNLIFNLVSMKKKNLKIINQIKHRR